MNTLSFLLQNPKTSVLSAQNQLIEWVCEISCATAQEQVPEIGSAILAELGIHDLVDVFLPKAMWR
jgi:hypothetical protein